MLRKCVVGLLLVMITLACTSPLMAQGKAKGLNKAFSKAGGKGGANSALNRAGQNASRVGGSLNRANGLGRAGAFGGGSLGAAHGGNSHGGESTAPALSDEATRHQRQLVIEQTNRNRRIAQAQHLREIAARNGNAELAANADRLETFANDHYRERVEHLKRFGISDPALETVPGITDPLSPPVVPVTPSEPMGTAP